MQIDNLALDSSEGVEHRLERSLNDLAERSRQQSWNVLLQALDYYNSLPPAKDLGSWRPSDLLSELLGRWSLDVDVSTDNITHYKWLKHPYRKIGDASSKLVDATGLMVCDHPAVAHSHLTAWEYSCAKSCAKPLYHEIQQDVDGHRRHYGRILLPLFEDGRVTRLLTASQQIHETKSFEQPPRESLDKTCRLH